MSLDEWVYRNYRKPKEIDEKVFRTLYKEYREKNIKELKEVAKLVSRWPKKLKEGLLIRKIGSIFDRNPETAKTAAKEAKEWELKAENCYRVLDSILFITEKGKGKEDVSAYLAEHTKKLLGWFSPEGYEELVKKVIGEFTYNKTLRATPTVGRKLAEAIVSWADRPKNKSNEEKFKEWLPETYKELKRAIREEDPRRINYILSPVKKNQYKIIDQFMGGSK